jgi:hypothetical protein
VTDRKNSTVLAAAATAAAATAALTAGEANATTVINVPLSAVLYNGNSFSGSFDISSYLNQGGSVFDVTSATVTVTGNSPWSPTAYVVNGYYTYFAGYYLAGYYIAGYYSYDCGWGGCSYAPYYAAYYAPYYSYAPYYTGVDGTIDTLSLDVGEGAGSGSDPHTNYYYYGPVSEGYGALAASADLSAADLSLANSTGLVNFTAFASTNSSINLSSEQLTFTLEEVVAPPPSGVPEPTTWAMLLAGVWGVGAGLRQVNRRKDAEQAAA